jgi:hypothetical protein
VYSDGRENRWDPVKLEESRQEVLDDLITDVTTSSTGTRKPC